MSCCESIFKGTFRSFFKAIGTIVGIGVGIGVFAIFCVFFSGNPYALPPRINPIILADADGNKDLLPPQAPAIVHINLHGVIGMGDLTKEKIHELLVQSRSGLLGKDRVKGIILHINTPGGTVFDSAAIYQDLLWYKETYHTPIYAYVDGLCASGGMYVASAADKIYTSSSSIIGSVGVISGPFFNLSNAMTTYGIGATTLTAGKDKDDFNPFRSWKNDEGASHKIIIQEMYEQFVNVVCAGRPMISKQNLVNEYGAQIFIAKQAESLGYVDVSDASYKKTLTDFVGSLKLEEKYQVVELVHERPFFNKFSATKFTENLLGMLGMPLSMKEELKGKPLYLYEP